VPEDAQQLRDHIDAAHAAAERLVQEAEARARGAAGDDVPPRGWEVPGADRGAEGGGLGDLHTVVALLDALRSSIPAELSAQLAEAVRELLLAVRALIDWYLERLERVPRPSGDGSPRVEDIPID